MVDGPTVAAIAKNKFGDLGGATQQIIGERGDCGRLAVRSDYGKVGACRSLGRRLTGIRAGSLELLR